MIIEAMQGLEERRRTAELKEIQTTIQSRAEELLNDPASPAGGDPAGDVTLVEFFDYDWWCARIAGRPKLPYSSRRIAACISG